MEETIFILNDQGQLVELNEQAYDSEDLLQGMLSNYPKLLAGSQISPDAPRRWILISRELGIPDQENTGNRWSVDHLFIDQDAIPTLVEVKRSTDTRIRREVIGQILDYAANAISYWKANDIIHSFQKTCEEKERDPAQVLEELIGIERSTEEFWEDVGTNLKAGKIRLLIVADSIPIELRRIIEFLNGQMSPAEILGVEIKQYQGANLKTLVPRIIGQTAAAQSQKSTSQANGPLRSFESYLQEMEEYAGSERLEIVKKIMEWSKLYYRKTWFGKGQLGRGSYVPFTIY